MALGYFLNFLDKLIRINCRQGNHSLAILDNKFYAFILLIRLELKRTRDLKQQQDMEYIESLVIDQEKVRKQVALSCS